MSNEIVKFSNQFNNVALKKFDAVHLDVLMAIASRVREKGTATVEFSFEELRGLMRLRKNLTNKQLADKNVQTGSVLPGLGLVCRRRAPCRAAVGSSVLIDNRRNAGRNR